MMVNAAIRGLERFVDNGRPFNTHNPSSNTWNVLPYTVSPVTWFVYYNAQRDFVNQIANDRNDVIGEQITMYIKGVVLVPWNVNCFDDRVLCISDFH